MRYFLYIILFFLAYSTAQAEDVDVVREAQERAQSTTGTKPDAKSPQIKDERAEDASAEELARLKQKINDEPQNLDAYFEYGTMASKLGKLDEAEFAFTHMIMLNPNLPRVKLELGLVYAKKGDLKESKKLFEEVLATNPPQQVKDNVNSILAQVEQGLKQDHFLVSAAFGFNRDSNATSAAVSGNNTFSDTNLPLTQGSLGDPDGQLFATASLIHLHKFDIDSKDWGASFTTILTGYRSQQETENQLDISLASIKTGPTFTLNNYNTQIGFAAGNSIITLNSDKYLKTPLGEFTLKYAPYKELVFDYGFTYEYRKFANSPTTLTNVNRTGNAFQNKFGATYTLTAKDLFTGSVTWRNEEARAEEFGNDQTILSLGYTRKLPYDMSLNILGNMKMTHYDDLDTTVSSKLVRSDRERSTTFTLSKKLSKSTTLTGGYQYKKVNSNIQNYEYHNHRFSWAVGILF